MKTKIAMKKVINACLGGRSFPIDEDAYSRLSAYLEHFKANLFAKEGMLPSQVDEVMEDIEERTPGIRAFMRHDRRRGCQRIRAGH